jgi:hypothetical protein
MQLRPPTYLPDDARELFNTIVVNSKANHFVAADVSDASRVLRGAHSSAGLRQADARRARQ